MYHPDKNLNVNSKDIISQINKAYEVLSDQRQKIFYDHTLKIQFQQQTGQNKGMHQKDRNKGVNRVQKFDNIFSQLFSSDRPKKQKEALKKKISLAIQLQFDQSLNGTTKTITYLRKSICDTCNGTKSKPGTNPMKCYQCHGTGFKIQGNNKIKLTCYSCLGQGIKITNPCQCCKGQGIISKQVNQNIVFGRGIQNQTVLILSNKGHFNGVLQIKVHVKKHPNIQRKGINVHSVLQISIIDAVLGCQIDFRTIYGEIKKIKINPGIQNGELIILKNEGFYQYQSQNKGHHFIIVKALVPIQINSTQKILYQQLKVIKQKSSNKNI